MACFPREDEQLEMEPRAGRPGGLLDKLRHRGMGGRGSTGGEKAGQRSRLGIYSVHMEQTFMVKQKSCVAQAFAP